jgi:hypothetical protein
MGDGKVGETGVMQARFAPYNANSGFFYVRNSRPSLRVWDSIFFMNHMQLSWASQQSAVNFFLGIYSGLDLNVDILCAASFVGGHQASGGEKVGKMAAVKAQHPIMFHAHFAKNQLVKVKRLRENDLWFVEDGGEEWKWVFDS